MNILIVTLVVLGLLVSDSLSVSYGPPLLNGRNGKGDALLSETGTALQPEAVAQQAAPSDNSAAEIISLFPYLASVIRNGEHVCSGSIISDSCVLTAAHCLAATNGAAKQEVRYSLFAVRVGFTDADSGGSVVAVAKYKTHSNADVAILKLQVALTLDRNVGPIPLANQRLGDDVTVIVSGRDTSWQSTNGALSAQLQQIPLRITKCPISFVTSLKCMNSPDDICQQDAGGPVIYNNTLHGVVSFYPLNCDQKFSYGFTAVFDLRRWIQSNSNLP